MARRKSNAKSKLVSKLGAGTALMGPPKVMPPSTPAAPIAIAPPKPPDPRDSGYFSQLAQNLFMRDSRLADIGRQEGYLKADNETAIKRLAKRESDDLYGANVGANKAGLFYSGQLGKQRGDIQLGYGQQRDDVNEALKRQLAGLTAERTDLIKQYGDPGAKDDYGLAGAEAYAAAIARNQSLLPAQPDQGVLQRLGDRADDQRLAAATAQQRALVKRRAKRQRLGGSFISIGGY